MAKETMMEIKKLSSATTHVACITAHFTPSEYRVFTKRMSEQFGTALKGKTQYLPDGNIIFKLVYSDCDSRERLKMFRTMPGIESAEMIE